MKRIKEFIFPTNKPPSRVSEDRENGWDERARLKAELEKLQEKLNRRREELKKLEEIER